MIEREELASRVNKIMETYLSCANLGNKRNKIFDEFHNKLTEPQNFKEEGGFFVPNTKGKIRLYMTPEHINPYFEVLTKKLDGYKKRVERNKIKCKDYETPKLEVSTASGLAKEAFDESLPPVRNSYKRDGNNKLVKGKDDLFEVCNKGPKSKGKNVTELTPKAESELKKLQRLHLYGWEIGEI